jgi:hypothetical protein
MMKREPSSEAADNKPPAGLLDDYFDIPAFAKELGKTTRTIWRWRAQRIGPAMTWIGGRLYVHKDTAKTWLRKREEPAQ